MRKLNIILRLLGFVKCDICGKIGHKTNCLELRIDKKNKQSWYVCRICKLSLLGD